MTLFGDAHNGGCNAACPLLTQHLHYSAGAAHGCIHLHHAPAGDMGPPTAASDGRSHYGHATDTKEDTITYVGDWQW